VCELSSGFMHGVIMGIGNGLRKRRYRENSIDLDLNLN
jgi:hypothetical protein